MTCGDVRCDARAVVCDRLQADRARETRKGNNERELIGERGDAPCVAFPFRLVGGQGGGCARAGGVLHVPTSPTLASACHRAFGAISPACASPRLVGVPSGKIDHPTVCSPVIVPLDFHQRRVPTRVSHGTHTHTRNATHASAFRWIPWNRIKSDRSGGSLETLHVSFLARHPTGLATRRE